MQKVEKRFDYNKKTDLNAKINATDNSFSILTDEIIEVSTDSTVAYTFRIETPTQEASDFENFVISRFYDNDYQFYIYRYKEPELIEEDDDYLIVSREQVNEDQINIGDFDEFISNKMFYDAENDCYIDVTSSGGILYVDYSDCGDLGVGGGGVPGGSNYGPWNCYNIDGDVSTGCIRQRGYIDSNGNPQVQTQSIPCTQAYGCGTYYSNNSNDDSDDTGSGSDNSSNNNDDLHTGPDGDGNYEAGGSGTPYNDGTTTTNDSADTVGVLPDWYTPEFIIDYYGITDQEEVGLLNNCNSDGFSGCDFCEDLGKYLRREHYSPEATAFGEQAYQAFLEGGADFNYLLNNRTELDNSTQSEIDNYEVGGFDTTVYDNFDPQQTWPNIPPIISQSDFVGWGTQGIRRNCMDYAKAQIAIKGYQISSYFTSNQTMQIYTSQNGVNINQLNIGISYLHYALTNDIPVIVGIDDSPGSPNPRTDNTTDHFVVIVGMGNDSIGKYFQFYDNASSDLSQGTNPLNRLYYNSSTGLISGTSQTNYAEGLTYILSMIRKSKPL